MADDITDEFAGVDLKDKRRNLRLHKFVAAKAKTPSASISAACGGWSDTIAAYRLLRCPKVTPAALLAPHREAVVRRCAAQGCVVVSQDTTEFDFSTMEQMKGLGPLNGESRRGLFMHGLYAVSENGLPLGLLHAEINVRDDEHFRINETRKQRPFRREGKLSLGGGLPKDAGAGPALAGVRGVLHQ